MKALIILGCEGHNQHDFCFCNGAENVVLDLEKIEGTDHYFDVIKYLDNVVKVFEQPCNKSHIISNAMYKLYEFEYISEEFHSHISYFYNMHRRCGLLLYAKPKNINI